MRDELLATGSKIDDGANSIRAAHVGAPGRFPVCLEENSPSPVHRISTDACTVGEVAAEILQLTEWLPSTAGDRLW